MVRTKEHKAPMNNRFDVLMEPEKTKTSELTNRQIGNSKEMRRNSKQSRSKKNLFKSKPNVFKMSKDEHNNAFPNLSSAKSPAPMENTTSMNFAAATKPEDFTGNIVDEVDPGWVKLTRNNNKTKYQYNKQSETKTTKNRGPTEEESEFAQKGLDAKQEGALYKLTERWQNYRDEQNTLYPNNSPYVNEKSLLEPLSDDCYETESDYSESDESLEDPDEFNDDI